jgi:hypothetical protein
VVEDGAVPEGAPPWGGVPPPGPPDGMTAASAAETFVSDRFRDLAIAAAMSPGPPPVVLPLPCCPGVPVGRADCIALCSALVDTPSFVASVLSVAVSNPPPRAPAAVPPGAAVLADAELLVLLLDEDEPQPATAPPKRAVVPTITATLRMRGFFMSTTIGARAERALGRR